MRLWKYNILNWLGDSILTIAIVCAAIPSVLLASQIIMNLKGGK